jgi:hypothetical protein
MCVTLFGTAQFATAQQAPPELTSVERGAAPALQASAEPSMHSCMLHRASAVVGSMNAWRAPTGAWQLPAASRRVRVLLRVQGKQAERCVSPPRHTPHLLHAAQAAAPLEAAARLLVAMAAAGPGGCEEARRPAASAAPCGAAPPAAARRVTGWQETHTPLPVTSWWGAGTLQRAALLVREDQAASGDELNQGGTTVVWTTDGCVFRVHCGAEAAGGRARNVNAASKASRWRCAAVVCPPSCS